ncbi:FadR family transcriptional regulator [Corallococcus exercitus]|uniref:FadR/GntR family transcriptional regulator n=1 Tax=Corallococcus exercitus TaxID=2316736 RepID=UPI000EA409EF|nr:GntR family transcriptional regulator [Corallococcus exercitus]RKG74592.1 FadR family transcriptional regulator [Corallococcus exercitus]
MVQVGLVAYVEEQLEREISLRRLPRNGQLGSEYVLARRYGVSRSTVREALRRLAARGLVVQRPGRVTRAVALDESLTLENLSLALHDERSEECRRLLEGFFSLKRQVLVELLVDCCASASDADLRLLEDTCFNLWDAARWHPGERCAQLEFELLRLAAQAVARPGHVLLIQSLQRAMRGNAARLLSFMGGESLREWAMCAMHALSDRDARTLQRDLPALLKACDERVLDAFAPAPHAHASPEAPHVQECFLGTPESASKRDEALAERPCVEERDLGRLAPAATDAEALGVAPSPHDEPLPVERDHGTPGFPAASGLTPGEPEDERAGEDVPGVALGALSDCRAGWDASSPEEVLQSEPPPTGSGGQTRVTVNKDGGPLPGIQGFLVRWALRLWCFATRSLRPPAS